MPADTPRLGHYEVEPRAMRAALWDQISIGNCVDCVHEGYGDGVWVCWELGGMVVV
jgi:hypothetical protein